VTLTAREAAEAISDGINWLAFLSRSPTADDVVSNRAAIQKALTEMAAAIDGLPGRVWASRPIDPGISADVRGLAAQVAAWTAGDLPDEWAVTAGRVLGALGMPGFDDEPERLSSMATLPYRLLAVAGTIAIGCITVRLWPENPDVAAFFGISAAAGLGASWPYFFLQDVSLSGSALTIGRQGTVNLKDITDVRGVGIFRPQVVLIEVGE
jgi:hypothetical protein